MRYVRTIRDTTTTLGKFSLTAEAGTVLKLLFVSGDFAHCRVGANTIILPLRDIEESRSILSFVYYSHAKKLLIEGLERAYRSNHA